MGFPELRFEQLVKIGASGSLTRLPLSSWFPAVSCRAVSVVALERGAVDCSELTVPVFPRIRLRTFGSTSIGPSPLGPGGLVTRFILSSDVFVRDAFLLWSFSQFSSLFRDVFTGRLVIVVRRSHLRSCTLDYGTAGGNPNCGQRVAGDNARVPKNICWFPGCIRSTSPEPKRLSSM